MNLPQRNGYDVGLESPVEVLDLNDRKTRLARIVRLSQKKKAPPYKDAFYANHTGVDLRCRD